MTEFEKLMERVFENHASDPGWIRTAEGAALLEDALSKAPAQISNEMDARLDTLGLLPKTEYVDDDGKPAFTVGQIAKLTRRPLEHLRRDINKLTATRPILLKQGTSIHRLH